MGKLFVTLFAFAPAPKTALYWPLHPDTRICPQLKSCTLTNFWLRDKLTATLRHCSQQKSCTVIDFRLRSNLYRDRASTQLNLYHDGKKCAIPSLHRDSFAAKVPGPCPVLALGNTTSPYCRAVMVNCLTSCTLEKYAATNHNGSSLNQG